MEATGVWWAVAGGWAIDLWLDEQTREHHDVEVAVRRQDLPAMHRSLAGAWELRCIDPPGSGWCAWDGGALRTPAFQLQARSATVEFDLFSEHVDDATWQFRRDRRITRPLDEVATTSSSGLPIVCPEVQLLYMAWSTEAKNQHDFTLTRPRLDGDAVAWLSHALAVARPDHPWRREL
jgi:hypothetical protein